MKNELQMFVQAYRFIRTQLKTYPFMTKDDHNEIYTDILIILYILCILEIVPRKYYIILYCNRISIR